MIQIPAKTFLIGEYVAMFGAPALLTLTEDCFGVDNAARLHPDCPAARFWRDNTGNSCNWGLSDPYQGRGGLGASSAEFLLAYQQVYSDTMDLQHLHQTYLAYAHQGKGMPPSGYDLLAQSQQGCVVIESNPIKVRTSSWGFPELGFILVHTGKKLPTHEHLGGLYGLEWKRLVTDVEHACQAILETDTDAFLAGIQGFSHKLQHLGFVAKHTQVLLEQWKQCLPLLAAKGCGAMGADVVVLFALRSNIDNIVGFLNDQGYFVLATHEDVYFQNAKK